MKTWVYRRPHVSVQRSIVRTVAPMTVAASVFPGGPGRPSGPSGGGASPGSLAGMASQSGPQRSSASQSGPELGQGV